MDTAGNAPAIQARTGAQAPAGQAHGHAHLAIGPRSSGLAVYRDGTDLALHQWALGTNAVRLSDPPTPFEIEVAIEAIEDAVMPTARQLHGVNRLVVSEAVFELLRGHDEAEGGGTSRLAITYVESLFNAVTDVAEGRPAASVGIRTDSLFVATMLIVREVMHHLGFTALETGVPTLDT